MKSIIRYFFLFFIFWLIVFSVNRGVFIISVFSFLQHGSLSEALHAFSSAFVLDLSTIGYLFVLPVFLTTLYYIFQKRWIAAVNDAFVLLLILIYCLLSVGELCLYQEWKTKLNVQALLHFAHPAEVFQSATFKLTLLYFSLVIVLTAFYFILFNKKFALRKLLLKSTSISKRILLSLLLLVVIYPIDIVILRGGIKAIPISESDAYYSQDRILNDAAVNPLWSLGHNVIEYSVHEKSNPYMIMPDAEADSIMSKLFETSYDSTSSILNTAKPNLVFLILESYAALEIPAFGGDPFAMFLDSLSKQGIAFTNCYASAYVSDQGIPAILSAYPSSPRVAIINQIAKGVNLPSLNKDLKPLGYTSGFYYGGQLNYGNIKSYLYNMNFDIVKERIDFPHGIAEGKLGIHDKDMAKLFVNEINKSKEPFFDCWFTLSSHSPYDIPEQIKPLTQFENAYVNTIVYTDQAMREFFSEAKKQSWFHNTMFVIVADHCHANQKQIDFIDKDFHRIPLIFFGDVIKKELRGTKVDGVYSQLDIVPTLLSQLHLKDSAYKFGKNMLNPATEHFAFYYFFHGSGFITDSCFASFQKDTKQLLATNCNDSMEVSSLEKLNDAFLQKAYEDYLSR